MTVTFKGSTITLLGKPLQPGGTLPAFTLTGADLSPVRSEELTGVRLFLTVPSLDTGVCDLEVKRFNQCAAEQSGVSVYAVSMDLPFAQSRWCGANGVNAVTALSDYRDRSFAQATGTLIQELGLLTRGVFLIDAENRLRYVEYVPEVGDHPDYDAAFAALKEVLEK